MRRLSDEGWDATVPVDHNQENLTKVKNLLDTTGPGFCLAKWQQVTMHLGTGLTHSCHHPKQHKIPLHELENNPSALHNTEYKKIQRKAMLAGEKPAECDYCWRVENTGEFSDRHKKSLEPWALAHHDDIVQLTGDENVYPSYLEVSFSNVCNLKCIYCAPEASSMWVNELKQHGPMKLLEGTDHLQWAQGWQDLDSLSYKNREFNPYVDAFWKWFPEAYKHLKVYRITGGEPLLSEETFRSMDFLIENPNPELEFAINSNLSVPDKLWDRFIEKLILLKDSGSVKKFTMFTSVEAWGERAEYIRTNLNFELFKQRYEQLLAMGNVRCVIMATYNVLSITSFQKLLEWQYALKVKYNPINANQHLEENTGFIMTKGDSLTQRKQKNPAHSFVAGLDIPYLRSPDYLDAQFSSHELVEEHMIPTMDWMSAHVANAAWGDHSGFEPFEVDKLKNILVHRLYFNRKNRADREFGEDIRVARAKFFDYINTLDERRNTNFLTTFPEMANFYDLCRRAKESLTKHDTL